MANLVFHIIVALFCGAAAVGEVLGWVARGARNVWQGLAPATAFAAMCVWALSRMAS